MTFAFRHGKTRGGVPQLVRSQSDEPDRCGGAVEHTPPEVVVAQHFALRRGEHELIWMSPDDLALQRVDQEAGERYGSALVGLRGSEYRYAVHLGH